MSLKHERILEMRAAQKRAIAQGDHEEARDIRDAIRELECELREQEAA